MENPSLHKFSKAFKKTGCFFSTPIFLSWKIFFIVHLKTFQYEKLYLWVNVWLFYHARSLAHGMLQRNSLTYSKIYIYIYTDTFARSMKPLQHLYSCPFSLHADSPEDEEYHHTIVLCCFYCRLFYVSENSFPLEPVLIHPRTYTPLYQHPPVI